MNSLLPVADATHLILEQKIDLGTEVTTIDTALGRTLAEDLLADRDFPPFDRVTMDGIAINFQSFEQGKRRFKIAGMQAAGETQKELENSEECLEAMTGACLPKNTDTVIRYEDIVIENGFATIQVDINARQNVHRRGEDHKRGDLLIEQNTLIRPPELAVAATIGRARLMVKKLPKIAVITSGDELVNVNETPQPHQIRHSNKYSISSLLEANGFYPTHFHVADDLELTKKQLKEILENVDVLIISGGVSMGKKDFMPGALAALGVKKLFHKIAQRPGKPFWFGRKEDNIIFALPGNPVSSFVCVRRYVLPWLRQVVGLGPMNFQWARLTEDVTFKPKLTYFLQVKLHQDEHAVQWATPIKGNGSGDFVNLVEGDAFIELLAEDEVYKEAGLYNVWAY